MLIHIFNNAFNGAIMFLKIFPLVWPFYTTFPVSGHFGPPDPPSKPFSVSLTTVGIGLNPVITVSGKLIDLQHTVERNSYQYYR